MTVVSDIETCVHEIFERQVARSPEATALVCGDTRYSYAELDRQANRLARLLRERGAGPGSFVLVHFTRSAWPILAILACHKSGAAYVPIDPSYPGERIRHIVEELQPVVGLTDSTLAAGLSQVMPRSRLVVLDVEDRQLTRYPDTGIDRNQSGVSPSSLAYVIYTSGTTGRPKGVMVEHRAVTWYVQAFDEVCSTGPDDRIFQGFSLSFDGSVEEIWMAFSNGSTLVVPSPDTPRFGDELAAYLQAQGITYLSTVPTMLATLTEDVPCLRTIVLSGEVCPADLVDRWAVDGRQLLNVYGPTETTVNTTVAECAPGQPVTIGRPIAGYRLHVVDAELRPVAPGLPGELLISGPTLARGYLGQPELTRERFIEFAGPEGPTRCYRTGDVVCWGPGGELEFRGRLDGQVKIRGYRVELAEIETVLAEHPQVRLAAVRLAQRDGLSLLAAYVVLDRPQNGTELDRESVRRLLEDRLPAYMVPSTLDVVPELSRTTSGKIDRGALPTPVRPLRHAPERTTGPTTEVERQIADVWQDVLGVGSISVEDDFFRDLGGYSLLAARVVTELRERIALVAQLRDLYECPTVRSLAARLQSRPGGDGQAAATARSSTGRPRTAREVFESLSPARRGLTYALQTVSLYPLALIPAIPTVVLLYAVLLFLQHRLSLGSAALIWVAMALGVWPVMLVLAVASKWVLIGRYRPGDHPLWGSFYVRWWLCARIQAFSGVGLLAGTPVMPLYFRLMGAKVGPRCLIDTAHVGAWDLISIGEDTSIGADTQLLGYRVENGMVRFGRVDIGRECFVGIHCALGLDVRMADGSSLDDQSMLPDGAAIPASTGYAGSPARPAPVALPQGVPSRSVWRRAAFGVAHLVAADLLGLLFLLPFAAFLAVYVLMYYLDGFRGLGLALIFSVPVGILSSCLALAAVRRLILPRLRPGTYPVESVIYLRKWLSDGLMRSARALLLPVYTTLYLPPWLRLMGARIGRRAELSTVWNFAPELIDVGPESFFADGSIIGGRRGHRGAVQVSVNRIGRRSFVGNSAILPVGHDLGDGCLLGVQSVTPGEHPVTPDGSEWLGSPPFRLGSRPTVGNFDETVTFRPTRRLYAQRAVIDGLRILIPGYLGLAAFVVFALTLYVVQAHWGLTPALGLAPLVGLAVGLCSVVVVAGLKKAVMGTFTPEIKPLWSMYVWLNEMVNGVYESVAAPVLAGFLGTPFAAPLLRLMGCRIGRRTYLATTLMSEFDLVEVGDYAALNQGVVLQNHLFEDRVFKSSRLSVGPEASIGNMTVVLYDTTIGQAVTIGPLSLLMKGEALAEGSRWHGIPTEHLHQAEAPA
jgi:non-ribosomal peptide synthetase-like protein